ncbi:enhanced intracellular survival protein Eis [Pontibacillus sp. HMF3514]|uniref:GNAT family N-acetyltransferase n=1 Tax=Pontibacillus sp. HMF3514 TaxID=2692425 RepID=UPI00131F8EAD|nr:GNAT family N-acetyltransferase [Pontibacillus sp. HMF3514]QHE51432.1 GNAT family N-acetyltransferase [Pontibacillus sp. HMF3514]
MPNIQSIQEKDYDELARIVGNAYPAFEMHKDETRQKFIEKVDDRQKNFPDVNHFGYFDEEQLKGTFRFHDFQMNLYGETIPVGGIGLVAVDLLHKKERIAKHMLLDFIDRCREKGYDLAALYPFRPDFYQKMGFGFGSKKHEYRIESKHLPNAGSKQYIVNVTTEEQVQLVKDCYNTYVSQQHGMMYRDQEAFKNLIEQKETQTVAFQRNGKIEGYASFSFQKSEENFLKNHIIIKELVYLHSEALGELMTFFHLQQDQIDRIIFHTSDEDFHFLPHDVRNGSEHIIPSVYHEAHTSGVGLMYRVLDVKQFLSSLTNHTFSTEDVTVKFKVQETLINESNVEVVVQFKDRQLQLIEEDRYDVEVEMNISEFSSLMMGAVSFNTLHRYGLIKISHSTYNKVLNRLFSCLEKPECMTAF